MKKDSLSDERAQMSGNTSGAKIHAKEYPLAKIFSPEFEYFIPYYQRPYAWKEEQAEVLFDDLFDFYKSETEEGYFLGSIVLIQKESEAKADVIDGQQRLTTLTILLSALASLLEEEKFKNNICAHILEPGNELLNLKSKPRLTLRETDKEFFSYYVQELHFEELGKLGDKCPELDKNPSRINIKKNSQLFLQKIEKNLHNNPDNIKKFAIFLVNQCFLVAVCTPNQDSACRVFSVLNSRGLDLQTTDIIKADIIDKLVTDEEQDEYSKRWEKMENDLGRDDFDYLFTCVRMIYAKEKRKKSDLKEFRHHVIRKGCDDEVNPQALISELEPYAIALATVLAKNYEAVSHAEEVNTYLRWLSEIGHSDWIPVAIRFLFLSRNENVPEYVKRFFNRLERLAAYMHICALNVNNRIKRYNDVIKELDGEYSFGSPVQAVELTDEEKGKMRETLNGNIYNLTPQRRKYLILRLNSFVSDGAVSYYDHSKATIEHVLPQTVHDNTEWAKLWPDEQLREEWVHRIANLVPLIKSRNSKARNFDFAIKDSAYFSGEENVTSYALTYQISKELEGDKQCTLEYLKNRQDRMLKVLRDKWEL